MSAQGKPPVPTPPAPMGKVSGNALPGASSTAPSRQATLAAFQALGYNRPPSSRPTIRGRAQSIDQVLHESGTLAQLTALSRDSQARLRALQKLLPPLLWAQLSAGPIEADGWCILVSNNAVAAKLRQWIPAMAAHLRTQGWPVQTIRVKVRTR